MTYEYVSYIYLQIGKYTQISPDNAGKLFSKKSEMRLEKLRDMADREEGDWYLLYL